MLRYTITFNFHVRVDYRERTFSGVHVTVFAENAKNAVTKAQGLLWESAYEVEVTNICAEEVTPHD